MKTPPTTRDSTQQPILNPPSAPCDPPPTIFSPHADPPPLTLSERPALPLASPIPKTPLTPTPPSSTTASSAPLSETVAEPPPLRSPRPAPPPPPPLPSPSLLLVSSLPQARLFPHSVQAHFPQNYIT